jgi:hypothetical protein
MNRGSVLLGESQLKWIQLLRSIYEFESIRVAGPGSYKRDISDCLWTTNDLFAANPGLEQSKAQIEELLKYLEKNRQIMIVRREGVPHHITRVAEIVRLLGHTYEYWHQGRPCVTATRWLIDDKRFPRKEVSVNKAKEHLIKMVERDIGTSDEFSNLRLSIQKVVDATAKYLKGEDWEKAEFTKFQIEATEEIIKAHFCRDYEKRTQILTAGVGSGKTIAFSMGSMIVALEAYLNGLESRRCCIFLYPRTALARDQWVKLSEIAKHLRPKLSVHFEHMEFYKKNKTTVREGVEKTYAQSEFPPLIITTLETLKRRLHRPPFAKVISERLSHVVLDEIHLVEDLTGTQIVHLLNRLRAICRDERALRFTGSSATVACPERHAAAVFGVPEAEVKVIEPSVDNMDVVGLIHHVFLKPLEGISTLGCLINSTSILSHNRRDGISSRGSSQNEIASVPKTICFADNLDLIGRWNADLRENERTENDFSLYWARKHPTTDDCTKWDERQREMPYALRFHNPLEQRLAASPGRKDPYEGFRIDIEKKPCEKCRKGERISFGIASADDMRALGRFVYRHPTLPNDDVERFAISNPWIFEDGAKEIGTLDLCPYLRAGACFWFPNDDFGIERIDGTTSLFEFSSVVRSRIYSSKVKPSVSEDDDLSSTTFVAPVNEVYGPISGLDEEKAGIPIDAVVSSPSLEVGIDLTNVTESIMFKAIRNASAYRQKAGRAGRELGSDTVNVTLLSARAMDFHYYRQPRKLTSVHTLDPIPLKRENPIVMRSAAYMGVWDHLALLAELPEAIPIGWSGGHANGGRSLFADRIERCLRHLKDNRADVLRHLILISEGKLTSNELEMAIKRVEDDLSVFLIPVSGIIVGTGLTCIADLVVNSLLRITHGASRNIALEHNVASQLTKLKRSNEILEIERKEIDPIGLGLVSEFEILDRMRKCGWSLPKLTEVISVLESKNEASLLVSIQKLKEVKSVLEDIESRGHVEVCFFKEQFERAFTAKKQAKAFYLSYVIEDIPLFDGYVGSVRFQRQKNLFTNPYEEEVSLSKMKAIGRSTTWEDVPPVLISEAMHSYIPGTWTHRMGQPVKVRLGELQGARHHLVSDYQRIVNAGSTFTELRTNVPGPPFFGPGFIDLYQPRSLSLQHVEKYVKANAIRGTIVDMDEDSQEPQKNSSAYVKIPKSYSSGWTHVTALPGEPLTVGDFETDALAIIPTPQDPSASVQSRIRHPLHSRLISDAIWLPKMDVIEYVFDVTRSFSSLDVTGATITFRDLTKEVDVGFGRLLETEGVRLDLQRDTFEALVSRLKLELRTNPKWSPSALLAFRALLGRIVLDDGTRLDPFTIKDLTGIVLFGLIDELDTVTFLKMIEKLKYLAENEQMLFDIAVRHFRNKSHEMSENFESEGGDCIELTDGIIEEEAGESSNMLVKVYQELVRTVPDLDLFLEEWLSFTLLNTLGVASYNSIQRLCGTGEDSIGYLPNLEGVANRNYSVYLYDRDEKGNGSSETVKRFFHILYVQRVAQADRSRLPTEDFLTILEQELLQCPQFHTDMLALEMFARGSGPTSVPIPELSYVHDFAVEVRRVGAEVWKTLGINGRDDAWKLPLYAAMANSAADHFGIDRDDLLRATSICWNGCPECVAGDQMLMGYLRGRDYVDKAILDAWFELGRSQTNEYKSPIADDIVSGNANLDIGSLSVLCIKKDKLMRSVSLPYTIGLELDRMSASAKPKLVIRDNDVLGLRLVQLPPDGQNQGISVGFGRLVWYNLLMTAYLESVGAIPADKKEVILVYYDIRDVTFQDIGATERMWEAIDHHRRASGSSTRIEKLSDLLSWLANRGFKIKICVDKSRTQEAGVRQLLSTLRRCDPSEASIELRVKEMRQGGVMHVKGLLTPVGTVTGSANLTMSAIERNDESVSVANAETAGYKSVRQSLKDTMDGSERWSE